MAVNIDEQDKKKYKPGKIRAENIDKILKVAEQEFVKHGYRGTSMQTIADQAGLPKANIHYYFQSKEKLYIEVMRGIMGNWNEVLQAVKVEDDPAEVLDGFIRKKVELAYRFPQASKLFAMEIIQGAPHLREYMRKDMRRWVKEKTRVLQTWIDQGRMAPVDPVHLIFLIWSSTQHYADFETQVLTVMNRAEYEEEDILHISDFLSSFILRGCGLEMPKR